MTHGRQQPDPHVRCAPAGATPDLSNSAQQLLDDAMHALRGEAESLQPPPELNLDAHESTAMEPAQVTAM